MKHVPYTSSCQDFDQETENERIGNGMEKLKKETNKA
jgi:hypothetical protein